MEIEAAPEEIERFRALLQLRDRQRLEGKAWRWPAEARPQQLPPDGGWFVWLIMAGRGWGKTRTGAEWLANEARTHPGSEYAVVGRTTQECRETCLEGISGLLKALDLRLDSPGYNRTTGQIRLDNGAVIHAYSAEKPESVRGSNLSGAWCDELATWRYPQMWTEGLMPALRIGRPQVLVTTTPRRTSLIRDLFTRDDGSVIITRGSTFDNEANLSPEALAELKRRYEGTRIGRQELMGELIEDVEGALWQRDMIDAYRAMAAPDLVRVVVAIDPAVTAGEGSDETGMVVAGLGEDGEGYVLADESCRLPPDQWARRAVQAYRDYSADRVVAEVNNGGELVGTVLKTTDEHLSFTPIHASRGKRTRAEPVAALYEQGKVHHVGGFPELEDQLCSWVPGEGDSPDRLDALVWALTNLMLDNGPVSIQRPTGELPRQSPKGRSRKAQVPPHLRRFHR